MLPVATSTPNDPPDWLTLLPAAIRSALRAVLKHCEQLRRVDKFKAKLTAYRETEKETGKALFIIPSGFSSELLHERSPRGEYIRAHFHLVFMPMAGRYHRMHRRR